MLIRYLLLALFSTVLAFPIPKVNGQATFEDVDMIPSTAVAAVYLRPAAIINDPTMELVPRELLTAWGQQEFGLDPCKIRNVLVLFDQLEDPSSEPNFAIVLRFDEAQALNEDVLGRGKKMEFRGKDMYAFSRRENTPVLFVPDDKTFVLGMKPFIGKMLDAKGKPGKLAALVNSTVAEIDHINAFVSVEEFQPFIDENLPAKQDLPWQLKQFRDLPEQIESLSLRLNFKEGAVNELKVTAYDEQSGKKVMKTLEQGLSMGRGMLMSSLAQQMRDQPTMLEAIESYDNRVGDRIEEMLKPEVDGRTLTFNTKSTQQVSNAAVIGTLIGMLLPAVQQTRAAARRVGSMNQLRQIALACLNYESAHLRFPGNITDADGKPLLSWRVAILPFIEQNDLYSQFHLDEPWDSEHNIKLLDQLPEIYANLQVDSDTKTVFLGFEGPGTIFEPEKKIGFGQITDGSSNTILCVEANPESAIEWTKPSDLKFDPEKDVTQVGDMRPSGFIAVLCDGSTHIVSRDLDQDTLKFLIQRNDGNVAEIR